MTDANYTHLAVVLDRSGSMVSIKDDMENGLNELFREQAKLPGVCLVDLAKFDTVYEVDFEDTPVADAKAVLQPRGGTALLDAIGKTVTHLGEKLASEVEHKRPGKVIVVVVTDGYENSSVEWTRTAVKDLVTQQQDQWNWEFIFLGANMDAIDVAGSYGFKSGSSITYAANAKGAANVTQSLNSYVGATRGGLAASFTDEDRENATASNK
jgi:hypothetical protein